MESVNDDIITLLHIYCLIWYDIVNMFTYWGKFQRDAITKTIWQYSDNLLFFAGFYEWGARANTDWESPFLKGVRPFGPQF